MSKLIQRKPAKWLSTFTVAAALVCMAVPQSSGAGEQRPRANRLIESLSAGKPAITGDTWIFVEAEHRMFSLPDLRTELRDILAKKNDRGQVALAPIVRLPMGGNEDSGWAIKQVLELGAMGIIIPRVETSEQVLRMVKQMRQWTVKDSKYPFPAGNRSAIPPAGWGLPAETYRQVADVWPLNPDGEIFFMPMLETAAGIVNAEEILETPGLGGVLVGPGDLLASMGYVPNYSGGQTVYPQEVTDAIAKVGRMCQARKKYCGMVTYSDAETQQWMKAGYMFAFQTDRPNAAAGGYAQRKPQ